MQRKNSRSQEFFRKTARERINSLFLKAAEAFRENSGFADRYVEIARKISTKYKVRIPAKFRRKFCKNCHKYLFPSVNCRIRISNKNVICYCFNCKNYNKVGIGGK